MKGIGKPCTGKLFARFDEGGLALPALYSTLSVFKTSTEQRISEQVMYMLFRTEGRLEKMLLKLVLPAA